MARLAMRFEPVAPLRRDVSDHFALKKIPRAGLDQRRILSFEIDLSLP
jgi:hypothetical protein